MVGLHETVSTAGLLGHYKHKGQNKDDHVSWCSSTHPVISDSMVYVLLLFTYSKLANIKLCASLDSSFRRAVIKQQLCLSSTIKFPFSN